jgi:hypothetical protein
MSDESKITPSDSSLDEQVGGDHYTNFKIQPGEFAELNRLTHFEGNVIKRICRHSRDGGKGIEDLRKIIHEVRLIATLQYGEEL